MMKDCTKCKVVKDLDAFYRGNGRFGHKSWCKVCMSAYSQQPHRKEYNRVQSRIYHTDNREVRVTAKARYRASIKGRALQLHDNAVLRAARLGVPFDLDRPWIEERLAKACELTGREFDLSLPREGQRANPNAPSLDRFDNSKGYTKDNVRVVTMHANVARNEFSDADLLALAHDIIRTISSRASQEEGSTTRSKDRRVQADPKPPAPTVWGDDIVSSLQ